MISRRKFLGSAGRTAGFALFAGTATMSLLSAHAQNGPASKEKNIYVGMLTAPFGGRPLVEVLDFAKSAGITGLEVAADPGSTHIDPAKFDAAQAETVKQQLAERHLVISALTCFGDACRPGGAEEFQNHVRKMTDAAVLLGVPTLCMNLGMPRPGMNRIQQIKEVVPQVFAPIIAYTKEKGVKIAIENWFETCLRGIDTFECLFETIKDENFGLNYDPSHLVHQECDYFKPVSMFSKRIFHTHAKDTLVDAAVRARVGIYGPGWWRYVVPGSGSIRWGEYINHLRSIGYRGVLSIENEDSEAGRDKGFFMASRYLSQFC